MAIHINNSKNLNATYSDVPIHYVPCKILADTDAKVKQYFEGSIKQDEQGVLCGSFRGYPLKGVTIEMPENYQGLILHESLKPLTEDAERKFFITHKFNSLSYWNWDKVPSKNDVFRQALDWIDIAEALHTPITED